LPATDEEIIRDLLHRYTDNVHPPASIATGVAARQRRRDRRRVVTVAAAGAALGTAAGVIAVVPGHSSPAPGGTGSAAAGKRPAIKLTADQRVLFRLGVVAARQPQPNGRYAVMSKEGGDVKDIFVIDSLTGNMWSYQEGTDGSPSIMIRFAKVRADQPRQALAAARAGEEAERHLGEAEAGAAAQDPQVAREGQFGAAAERVPIHRRDDGLGREFE
jgi:hypothetical protein